MSTTETATQATYPRTGLATASLVCGACGIAFPMSILFAACIAAIICGHIALSEIKQAPGIYGGKNRAIAGLVLGYLGAAIGLIVGVVIAYMRASLKASV